MLMLFSLLAADMGTTAVNNYQDFKRAQKKEGYNYEVHNAVVSHDLDEKTALAVIFSLFSAAAIFGFILYIKTDIVVLVIGVLSFMIGILYTSGPVPISRTPSGEIFSGFTMGFFIPFLSIYIHNTSLIEISSAAQTLVFKFEYIDLMNILIFSLPMIFGIANIMLANNICDLEDDLENERFTLPIYIGKRKSLKLYKNIYYASYLAVIAAVILDILPVVSLLSLLSYIPVKRNIDVFFRRQSKKDTFVTAVKNFALINYSLAAAFLAVLVF